MHAGRSRGPLTCGVNLPRRAVPFRSGEGEASDKGTRIGLNRHLGTVTANEMIRIGSKQGKRKLSYNESVDEPAKLIADEAVEVEAEIPAEENEPVERIEMMIVSNRPCLMSLRLGMRTKLALCAGVSRSAGYGHPLRLRAERQPHRHGIASV